MPLMGSPRLLFYFDFSCPYAYLAATQIEAIAERGGAELVWRPMLLGGVFRSIGTGDGPMATMGAAKARHNGLDMYRWADHFDVPLTLPSGHPMRTVAALRALLTLPEERWSATIAAVYRAYWQKGLDISQKAGLRAALADVLEAAELEAALAGSDDSAVKDELRRRTDEAVARGVFGAPTMFIERDGEEPIMLWGQDRLAMTRAALEGWRPGEAAPTGQSPMLAQSSASAASIEFWYDFSSPFAYLASTQVEALAARTGATLHWRPMLLGALFRDLGTVNVPLLSMSEAKRRYLGLELTTWAAWWQVPFHFTSHFPLRTITALRLALGAGPRIAELSHALFRAAWAENRDLADPDTLAAILTATGFDAAGMLAATQEPAAKQALIDNTSEAQRRGVFGAPTLIISRGGQEFLLWGQDRLELAADILGGWTPGHG